MSEQSRWQVSGSAAEIYERCFVPAIFGQWAPQLADAAQIGPEDRVLDVGCGTGVLARAASERVATESQVSGVDRNEGMLAVARRIRPTIDWRQEDAVEMSFRDASFDVVASQFALMYFADRAAALREMRRVLKPDGRVTVAVWGPFERATGYVLLTDIAQRRCGQTAADVLTAPFALGQEGQLLGLFQAAGFAHVHVELRAGTMTFPSIATFVETEVKGSPLEALLDDESYGALVAGAEEQLDRFRTQAGEVVMPLDAFLITGENC